MIEQTELNQAFLQDMASQAKPSFLEGMASQAELFFPKARAKTELSRVELRLGPNTNYHNNRLAISFRFTLHQFVNSKKLNEWIRNYWEVSASRIIPRCSTEYT